MAALARFLTVAPQYSLSLAMVAPFSKTDSHAPSGKRVETWEDMRQLEFYASLFDRLKPTPEKLVPRVA